MQCTCRLNAYSAVSKILYFLNTNRRHAIELWASSTASGKLSFKGKLLNRRLTKSWTLGFTCTKSATSSAMHTYYIIFVDQIWDSDSSSRDGSGHTWTQLSERREPYTQVEDLGDGNCGADETRADNASNSCRRPSLSGNTETHCISTAVNTRLAKRNPPIPYLDRAH